MAFAAKAFLVVTPLAAWAVWGCGRYVFEPSYVDRLQMACKYGVACFSQAFTDIPDRDKVAYVEAACNLGHGEACTTLGAWHHQGVNGLTPDPAASLPWFDRGCTLDIPDACMIADSLRNPTQSIATPP